MWLPEDHSKKCLVVALKDRLYIASKFSSQMVRRNMGCWVFKGGIQNKLKRFLAKYQHTQMKLLYFANTHTQGVS